MSSDWSHKENFFVKNKYIINRIDLISLDNGNLHPMFFFQKYNALKIFFKVKKFVFGTEKQIFKIFFFRVWVFIMKKYLIHFNVTLSVRLFPEILSHLEKKQKSYDFFCFRDITSKSPVKSSKSPANFTEIFFLNIIFFFFGTKRKNDKQHFSFISRWWELTGICSKKKNCVN
jgi:hypothetical protein